MGSSSLYRSLHFDSPEQIAEDLTASLGLDVDVPVVAFLFCDSQVEYAETVRLVADKLPCPVVGGTALGFPSLPEGSEDVAAMLLVVRKKGMQVSLVVSEPLDTERYDEQMRDVFSRCREGLSGEPRLVMPFFPLLPGLAGELFRLVLFEQAGEIPVFGGTTTGDFVVADASVFANGAVFADRMALLMLGGDIQPVHAVGTKVTTMQEYSPVVTESQGNRVIRVDGMLFCDYMQRIGLNPEDRINGVDALMQYGPTPVEMQIPGRPEDGVPAVRCISYTDLVEGSAVFSGIVPEGTRLKLSILRKEDVADSAELCLRLLKERMREKESAGYTFSASLCISCVARYVVLVGDNNLERQFLQQHARSSVPQAGFYAYSEVCPTTEKASGKLLNRSHSASIIMCAF